MMAPHTSPLANISPEVDSSRMESFLHDTFSTTSLPSTSSHLTVDMGRQGLINRSLFEQCEVDSSLDRRNKAFINSQLPHVLLLNPSTFPIFGKGRVEHYVDTLAKQLAKLSYKVTIARQASNGMEGIFFNKDLWNVRRIFVHGRKYAETSDGKVQIHRLQQLPESPVMDSTIAVGTIAYNLLHYLAFESSQVGMAPWNLSNILYLFSHNWDGALLGQSLLSAWTSEIVTSIIMKEYGRILPLSFKGTFSGDISSQLDHTITLQWSKEASIDADPETILFFGEQQPETTVDLDKERLEQLCTWINTTMNWDDKLDAAALFSENLEQQPKLGIELLRRVQTELNDALRSTHRHIWAPHYSSIFQDTSLMEMIYTLMPRDEIDGFGPFFFTGQPPVSSIVATSERMAELVRDWSFYPE